MRVSHAATLIAALLLASAARAAPSKIDDVTVKGTRVRLGDLVSGLSGETAAYDLGPTPASAGTRLIGRDEVLAALREHSVDAAPILPEAFRVHRQLRVLLTSDITLLVTHGLQGRLTRGATLGDVRSPPSARVPDGWTRVRCDIPRPPHRTGSVSSAVVLTFFDDDEALWTLSVPVYLALSQEAMAYDVPRGTRVTFVVRRGLVEVRTSGTVTADVDVGSVAPVTVSPSGRSFPARLEDDTTAIMVEGS